MTKPDPGLFITKGMKGSIEKFSLSMGYDGSVNQNKMVFHTGLDMSPYWLNIAWNCLLKTERYHKKILNEVNAENQSKLGLHLQNEFQNGMQTIMAACIAMDAYYATIKEHASIPNDLLNKWKENKTARYKQISETLKRTFTIPEETFLQMRVSLEQSFKLRDKAVHPKSGTDLPVLHPEANIISDWRFSAFRYANSKAVVQNILGFIYLTTYLKIPPTKKALKVIAEKHRNEIKPIVKKWDTRYGNLLK